MNLQDNDDRLETLEDILDDYKSLCQQAAGSWVDLELVVLKEPEKYEQQAADRGCFDRVIKEINSNDQQGWVRFRSDVDWTGSKKTLNYEECGPPLYAEWSNGTNISFRLRADQDAPGMVRVWQYDERQIGEITTLKGDELGCLRETSTVMARTKVLPGQCLVYHIYWAIVGEEHGHSFRRLFDRFVGFEKLETK